MALLNGKPIKVFEDQDHQAHIAVHQQFINDPRFGGNPQAKEVLYPLMMAHLGQHMAYLYQQQMQAQVPEGMITSSGEMNKELRDEEPKELDIEQENRIAAAAAQAAQSLMGSMPPSPEQQQQQMQMELKQEELSIRKARFAEGVKDKERVNARKDAETKARIIETASRVAKRD
jgi:transcriptional regulator of acetoin/glycerol metabolism